MRLRIGRTAAVFAREARSTAGRRLGRTSKLALLSAPTAVAIGAVGLVGVGIGVGAAAAAPGNATTAGSGSVAASTAVSTAGFPSGAGNPGIFTDRCGFSHEAPDDPILMPGKTGMSMQHDFYGNTGTSATSTAASLVGGQTLCTTSADASAYWTPVLYQNGHALTPSSALIYWRRPPNDTEAVTAIPAGLQMIAGNEKAMAPQPKSVVAWSCTGVLQQRRTTTTPHDCMGNSHLRLVVTFPSCWDGHTLSGATQTDVVYRGPDGCPASHPVQIPQVVFHVSYPTSSAAGLTLSMGPTMQGSVDTAHVDFINGWTESIMQRDTAACVATSTRCGPVTGPEATPQGPSKKQLMQEQRMKARRAARMHH